MTADKLPHVHLVTCVGVDTEFAHLPHFLDHYLGLGIPGANCHVMLNTTDASSPNLERAQALLNERGIAAPEIWIAPYTSDSMWAKRRTMQSECVPPEDWVISADVDELHEYPESLSVFLAECEARGVTCAQGVFIDRLAPEGKLAEVDPEAPIWDTFPIQADVQCTIGQTGDHHDWFGTVKIMALKGSLVPSRGGHHPQAGDGPINYLFGRHLATFPRIGDARFRFRVPLRVHHFKWTASMPAILEQRLATPGVSVAGAEYGQKLIDYFATNDGVRLADVPVRRPRCSRSGAWRRRLAYLKALDAGYWYSGKARRAAHRVLGR